MADALRLRRLEVWSDLECAGGVRLGFYSPPPLAAVVTRVVNERQALQVDVDRSCPVWALCGRGRVVRTVRMDYAYEEWRVRRPTDAHERDGRQIGRLECEHPFYDLQRTLVERLEASGEVMHDFDLPGLTAAEQYAFLLAQAPAYWSLGDVEITDLVDVPYRGHSVLSGLQQVIAQLQKGELEWERVGTTGYRVHLRTAVGSTAPRGRLKYRRNLDALRRTEDGPAGASRIYPLGGALEDVRHHMGAASWEITAISGAMVTLDGELIAFDDQLNGLYAEIEGTDSRTAITDTVLSTQQIQVSSTAGMTVGARILVRRDSAGTQLTYLERPGEVDRVTQTLERPDLPPVDNLVPNAFLSEWSGGVPTGWAEVGGASLTEITDTTRFRHGRRAAQVVSLSEEGGIESDWIDLDPTAERPFFLVQATFFPVEGTWRLELVGEDPEADEVVVPDATAVGGRAVNTATGVWIERLSVQDQATNFAELDIVRGKLRLVADQLDGSTGQASCYVDAGVVAQTHLPEVPFHDGRASNDLWRAANARLVALTTVPTRLEVDVIDLHRTAPDVFRYDALVLGGTVELRDDDLDVLYDVRIRSLKEDLLRAGAVEVELSDRVGELTDVSLGIPGRRTGVGLPPGGVGSTTEVDGFPVLDEDDGDLKLVPYPLAGARSVRWLDSASQIDAADLLGSGNVADGRSPILVHQFTEEGEKRYVSVGYYPGADGQGKVGAIHHLTPHTYSLKNNIPVVHFQVLPAPDKEYWRIVVTITDDGDAVYAEHRWYAVGATPGAFTRNPGSGTISDPHSFSFDVPKPATDTAADHIVEVYGYDDAGNRSRLLYLKVQRNQVVSGNQLKSVWLEVHETIYDFGGIDTFGAALYLYWQTESETVESVSWALTRDAGGAGTGTFDTMGATAGRFKVAGNPLTLLEGEYEVTATPHDAASGGGNQGPQLATAELEYEVDGSRIEDEDDPGTIARSAVTRLGPGLTRDTVSGQNRIYVRPEALTEETTPGATDVLIIQTPNGLRKVQAGNLAGSGSPGAHTHDASDIVSGTLDDARVPESSVTQHQSAIDHGSIGGLEDNDHPQYSLKASPQTISGAWDFTQEITGVGLSVTGDVESNTSDERLKRVVGSLDDPLGVLRQLAEVVFYEFESDELVLPEGRRLGLLAQRVQAVLPEAVYEAPAGYLGVHTHMIVALLVAAVDQLARRPS